jgi:hypothetical protein
MEAASQATAAAAPPPQVKSLMSLNVSIVIAICSGIVLWKGISLIVAVTMTAGALTVSLNWVRQVHGSEPERRFLQHRARTAHRHRRPVAGALPWCI